MEYNSSSNRASNFKSDLKLRARLPLNCTARSPYYQLIVSITKCMKLFVVSVKAGRSLAVLVVLLVLLISVGVSFSSLSKLSKSIVLNRLSNSKENITE